MNEEEQLLNSYRLASIGYYNIASSLFDYYQKELRKARSEGNHKLIAGIVSKIPRTFLYREALVIEYQNFLS